MRALFPTLLNIPHDVLNVGRISKFCFIGSFFLNISTYKIILIVSDLMKKNYKNVKSDCTWVPMKALAQPQRKSGVSE